MPKRLARDVLAWGLGCLPRLPRHLLHPGADFLGIVAADSTGSSADNQQQQQQEEGQEQGQEQEE